MALQGTFQEPIEPFTALSSNLNRRLCEQYQDPINTNTGYFQNVYDNKLSSFNSSSDQYNDKDIGVINDAGYTKFENSAEYPLSGTNWVSYSGIWIYGYSAKEIVEFYYSLKKIKISFTSNWSTTWFQKTVNEMYNLTNRPELMNPNTNQESGTSQDNLVYNSLYPRGYTDSSLDWNIPTERVCSVSPFYLAESREQYTNSAKGNSASGNYYVSHYLNSPNSVWRVGENNYSVFISSLAFPRFYLFRNNAGTATQTPFGYQGISRWWTPAHNSFHKATFRYVDAEANKDISGEIWYRYYGAYDTQANSASVHIDIETERFQFQNP